MLLPARRCDYVSGKQFSRSRFAQLGGNHPANPRPQIASRRFVGKDKPDTHPRLHVRCRRRHPCYLGCLHNPPDLTDEREGLLFAWNLQLKTKPAPDVERLRSTNEDAAITDISRILEEKGIPLGIPHANRKRDPWFATTVVVRPFPLFDLPGIVALIGHAFLRECT
jgi:hypothetical protein